MYTEFLPISKQEMIEKGIDQPDFVVVGGDAYVDHPSFGTAVIARLVEALGFKVCILAQPDFSSCESFKEFGKPKYGFLIGSGNVDSMVTHYTVAKRRRDTDDYSPGGKGGLRPDRALTVYSRLAKQAYPDLPVVIGGIEGSLRRFAHYDYWNDEVMPSILVDTGADILSYGMSERQTYEIVTRLAKGEPISSMTDIPGTCYMTTQDKLPQGYVECAGFNRVKSDKIAYSKATRLQMENQDHITGKTIVQKQTDTMYMVQNPPARPLYRKELDKLFTLPFTRLPHPSYEKLGGVPSIREVEFSIIHNRGCFGGCNFCAITMHQGRFVTSRSHESVVREAEMISKSPNFKGYIHDVGGPTADFRFPSCRKQVTEGLCSDRKCLAPTPCPNLLVDHSDYLELLRKVRNVEGVKKVFVRSGLRFDYMMQEKNDEFITELVQHHVSGQLKVAPEHLSNNTLKHMGKPPIGVYDRFSKKFYQVTKKVGKEQYLVPYLMSSHPGSTIKDAVDLAVYLAKNHIRPEQVQDFYPTPGTISTSMYYTGLDPYTLKPVYVAKDREEKALQRALLQYYNPKNRQKVLDALKKVHREDLIPLLLGTTPRAKTEMAAKGHTLQRKKKPAADWREIQKRNKRIGKNKQ
ncbi:MAG: YgiQ family radical SAM protein [Ruminococcaceae bacterium]|nr:YgiQ family radical SAM protein [Oscillospiraceae bacterium]